MAASSPAAAIPPDPVRLLPDGGLVLAVTDDRSNERSAAVLAAAAGLARTATADIVLFLAPRGGGPGARHRRRLIRLLTSTRGTGCRIRVWRSWRSGATGIAEAVAGTGADLVLLPDDRDMAGDRAIRRTLAYYAMRLPIPVVAVDRDGAMSSIRPLEPRPDASRALGPGVAARTAPASWRALGLAGLAR